MQCVRVKSFVPAESTEVFAINMSSNVTLNEPRKDLESQSSKPSGCNFRPSKLWWSLLVDAPLFLLFLALVLLFEMGIIPNHKAGFYCNDPALSFPYTGETVTPSILMSMVFLLPIVVALPSEFIQVDSEFSSKNKWRQAYRNSLYIYRTYIFGLFANLGIVEVIKGLIGSPRPIFFDLCQPDTAATCNGTEFVSSFECTSTKYSWWDQMDSYRSFPSGHASMSVYCGFFVAWYLQKRAFDWSNKTIFLVPVIQLLALSFSAVSSLTRITDNKHHWWDVLVGTIIGFATVYYAIIALSNNFSYKTKSGSNLKSEESRNTVRTFVYDEGRPGPLTP